MDPRHPRQNSYLHHPRHFFDSRQNFKDPRNPRDPHKFSTHVTHAPTHPHTHATHVTHEATQPRNLADSGKKCFRKTCYYLVNIDINVIIIATIVVLVNVLIKLKLFKKVFV